MLAVPAGGWSGWSVSAWCGCCWHQRCPGPQTGLLVRHQTAPAGHQAVHTVPVVRLAVRTVLGAGHTGPAVRQAVRTVPVVRQTGPAVPGADHTGPAVPGADRTGQVVGQVVGQAVHTGLGLLAARIAPVADRTVQGHLEGSHICVSMNINVPQKADYPAVASAYVIIWSANAIRLNLGNILRACCKQRQQADGDAYPGQAGRTDPAAEDHQTRQDLPAQQCL